MKSLFAAAICFFALANPAPTVESDALERRQVAASAAVSANVSLDVNKLLEQIAGWTVSDLSEGLPWSKDQMTNYISKIEGDKIYVNCLLSSDENKGCPAEFPWRIKKCFPLKNGGVLNRVCTRVATENALWDAGSFLRKIYDTKPPNYDKLMTSPGRFDVINKIRFKQTGKEEKAPKEAAK